MGTEAYVCMTANGEWGGGVKTKAKGDPSPYIDGMYMAMSVLYFHYLTAAWVFTVFPHVHTQN